MDKEFPFIFEFGFGFFFFDAPPCGTPPSSSSSDGIWIHGLVADREDFCETFFFATIWCRSTNVDLTSDCDILTM